MDHSTHQTDATYDGEEVCSVELPPGVSVFALHFDATDTRRRLRVESDKGSFTLEDRIVV